MTSIPRAAKKFARSVKMNTPYYSVDEGEPVGSGAETKFTREWIFTKRHPIFNVPMCGHMSAVHVWLYTNGEISSRHPGLPTVEEISKLNNMSVPPLDGYAPPAGWSFSDRSDPEDLWAGYR